MREPRPISNSSLSALQVVVGVALLIITILFYAQNEAATVAAVILTDGLVALAWIAAATLLGRALLRMLKINAGGLLGWTTSAGLGLGLFSLIMLGLGLSGMTSRLAVLVMMASGTAGGALTMDLRQWTGVVKEPAPMQRMSWIWIAAVPFLAASAVGACVIPGFLWKPGDPHPYDVLVYHLQIPREWYELGRMTPLHHNVFSYFPFNAEMHYWAAMYLRGGSWAGMYTAQFMSLGFAVLAGLTIFAGAREGFRQKDRLIAGVMFASIPWIVMLSCVAYVETLLLLFTALSIVWTLRAIDSSRQSNIYSFAIAGVMAGFAAGTKITAAPMLIAALPISLVLASLIIKQAGTRISRKLLAGCSVLILAAAITLSPWLIRNLVWSGNPVFPLAMNMFGRAGFSQDQVDRFILAHSAPQSSAGIASRVMSFGTEVLGHWQYGYALWPLALVGAIQQRRYRQTWVCVLLLICMAGVWIFATHLISRFFVIAIPAAVLLVAKIEWGRWSCAGIAIVLLSAGVSFAAIHARLTGWANVGRSGAFGLLDLRPLVPDLLAPVYEQPGGIVVMAGDSQAFLHPVQMSRLRYRMVFNLDFTRLDVNSGRQMLGAWAGQPLDRLPPGSVIYVDPVEWDRLAKTYHIPPIPADIPGPRDRQFLITPEQLGK